MCASEVEVYPAGWFCDGRRDCSDASDEQEYCGTLTYLIHNQASVFFFPVCLSHVPKPLGLCALIPVSIVTMITALNRSEQPRLMGLEVIP